MHQSIFLLAAILPSCVFGFYPYVRPAKGSGHKSSGPNGHKSAQPPKRDAFYTWIHEKLDYNGDSPSAPPTMTVKRAAQPEDVHPHIRNIQEANHVIRKYRARGIPGPVFDGEEAMAQIERYVQRRGTPVRRNNAYPIETAVQPTYKNSMAVHQDGTDFSYFSAVNFGSSAKPLYMLVDTGSANTWVMQDTCKSASCVVHNLFGKSTSTSLTLTSEKWSVAYGSGTVNGVIAKDNVAFAGLSVPLSFGLASNVSDDFLSYPIDGIMGLGRPQTNSLNTKTVMETLVSQKLIKSNLFAISLQRHSDGSNNGVVTFGDWDKSAFEGDLSWIASVSQEGLWEIPVGDVSFKGAAANFIGKTAIIDTGTSMILMPSDDAKKLHSLLPQMQQKGENFEVLCSTTDPIIFTLGGVTYEVPPKDYIGKPVDKSEWCATNIIGRQTFGPNQWLIGDTFLKNVYSVFDLEKNRIGFGKKAQVAQAQAAATSSGQSPSSSSTLVSPDPSSSSPSSDPSKPSSTHISGLPAASSPQSSQSGGSITASAEAAQSTGTNTSGTGSSGSSTTPNGHSSAARVDASTLMAMCIMVIPLFSVY